MTDSGRLIRRRAAFGSLLAAGLACAGCGNGEPPISEQTAKKRRERLIANPALKPGKKGAGK